MQLTQITDVLARLDEAARLNADLQRAYRLKRAKARRPAAQAAQAKFRAERPKAYAKIRAKAALTRKATAMTARDGVTLELLAEADRLCREWLDAAEFLCAYCGKDATRVERTIDHRQARSRGGKHTPANLAKACKSCNSRKSNHAHFYA